MEAAMSERMSSNKMQVRAPYAETVAAAVEGDSQCRK